MLREAKTLEVQPELLDRERTTSQPRMRTSAKLVSSLCQGVGGLSEFGAAGQDVGDSPDMCATMRTRRMCYHLSPTREEPRASRECLTLWCWIEVLDSVAGGCGYWRVTTGGQLRG